MEIGFKNKHKMEAKKLRLGNIVKEETDLEIAERGCSEIKKNIEAIKSNIDFILANKYLLKNESLHAPIGYINIGFQSLETILDEIESNL